MRLAKYLAHSGVASRRKAELIISEGRVTVGGRIVTDPATPVETGDDVRVDRRPAVPEGREVWIVNKPVGVNENTFFTVFCSADYNEVSLVKTARLNNPDA